MVLYSTMAFMVMFFFAAIFGAMLISVGNRIYQGIQEHSSLEKKVELTEEDKAL